MKKALFVVLAGVCVFASCKKNNEIIPSSDIVWGKWQLVSRFDHKTYGGSESRDTTYGMGQYLDLRSDGKAYSYDGTFNGVDKRDTLPYKLIENGCFIIDHGAGNVDTFEIRNLTRSSFVAYQKVHHIDGYSEATTKFKK